MIMIATTGAAGGGDHQPRGTIMAYLNDHLRTPVQKREGVQPGDKIIWSSKISRLENLIMNQPETDER